MPSQVRFQIHQIAALYLYRLLLLRNLMGTQAYIMLELFEFMQQNPQAQQQIRAPLFEDKVVDYILELAKVTEKKATKEDLEKAVEEIEKD